MTGPGDTGIRRGRIVRWLARPPGVPLALAATSAGLTLAYGCSVPAGYFGTVMVGVMGMAAAAGIWAIRAVTSVVACALLGDGWATGLRRLAGWRWWVAPGILAVLALVTVSGASLQLGWLARRRELAAIAEAWRKDPRGVAGMPGADRIPTGSDGMPSHPLELWFPSQSGDQPTRGRDDGFAVWVPGTGFIFERGCWVHAPTLAADSPLRPYLKALGDGWYAGRLPDP